MRAIMAIVVGILAGFVAMLAIGMAGDLIFPSNARIDSFDIDQVTAAFPNAPTGVKLAIILSWFLGPLIGAYVAKRMAGRGWAAWTTAGVFAVYVLLNVLILPMPGWLQAVAVAAPLLGGLIANHLVAERPGPAETLG